MIVTMIGPIHPRMPLDGIGGTEPLGQGGLVTTRGELLGGRLRGGWTSAAASGSGPDCASAASAGGAVPVTGPS